jgi:hypothetical protein
MTDQTEYGAEDVTRVPRRELGPGPRSPTSTASGTCATLGASPRDAAGASPGASSTSSSTRRSSRSETGASPCRWTRRCGASASSTSRARTGGAPSRTPAGPPGRSGTTKTSTCPGRSTWVDIVPRTAAPAAAVGAGQNTLGGQALRPQLSFPSNGQGVAPQTDGRPRAGSVGVFVGGGGSEVVSEVVVERLVVRVPGS